MTQQANVPVKAYARLAGVLYLLIAFTAIIPHFYMPDTLIEADNAAQTAQNILDNMDLFRAAIAGEIVILLSEVILSVLLYILLKPINRMLAITMTVSRLVMTIVHAFNLINYFMVLLLLSDISYLASFESDQLHSLVMLFLDAHHYGFSIGLIFFVLHVFILGYMLIKADFFPSVLGWMFLVAALGYLIDNSLILFATDYDVTPAYIALPIIISEIALPIWLIARGINKDKWLNAA